MLKVDLVKGNIEKALKKLKQKVRNTKQTQKLRNGKTYTKPSESKREKMAKATYKQDKYGDDEV
jgi:small subunit ribosomal protein S21|tara:strand:+ start:43412 stop:43603 length:192 start_codon:yes stop_codon:yes gene_type:complete